MEIFMNFISLSLSLSCLDIQEIKVTPVPGDDDYVMAESKGTFGKIPSTYIELL